MDKPAKRQPMSVLARSSRISIAPVRRPAPSIVTCLFVLLTIIPQAAIAAPQSPKAQNLQNPNITFEKGLLSVQVEDVRLKALMEEITQKAGIGVSVSESLKEQKVTVQFDQSERSREG